MGYGSQTPPVERDDNGDGVPGVGNRDPNASTTGQFLGIRRRTVDNRKGRPSFSDSLEIQAAFTWFHADHCKKNMPPINTIKVLPRNIVGDQTVSMAIGNSLYAGCPQIRHSSKLGRSAHAQGRP